MNRKGQEEGVGFVLIIVIVVIVFLILMGIMIRQKSPDVKKESRDITQFLESAAEYTSDCAMRYEPAYSKVGDLMKECHRESFCISKLGACEVLENTLRGLIDSSWQVGANRPIKGYILNITYESNQSSEEILAIIKGNCGFEIREGEYLYPDAPGTIVADLKLCS